MCINDSKIIQNIKRNDLCFEARNFSTQEDISRVLLNNTIQFKKKDTMHFFCKYSEYNFVLLKIFSKQKS